MRYPNARAGVKKIFIAELFELISAILVVVSAAILCLPEASNSGSTLASLAGWLLIGAVAPAILAFIFQLIGLIQAKRDEGCFGNALVMVFMGIIALLIRFGFSFINAVWAIRTCSILTAFANACSVVVVLYILSGISNLADDLGEHSFANHGRMLRVILTILFLVSIVLDIISTFVRPNENASRVMGFVAVGAAVIDFIAEVWYFIYLARAPKKLSK